jgi:nucleoside-diphosphate-sugar epimerase
MTAVDVSHEHVMVIGGSGFIGRHACEQLDRAGARVTVMARRRPDADLPGRFISGDVATLDHVTLAGHLSRSEVTSVVNSTGSIWGKKADDMWAAAAQPGINVARALASLSDPPRLVHLGSIMERSQTGDTDDLSPYGAAKRGAFRAVQDVFDSGAVHGTVLRIANAIGPGLPETSLLGAAAGQLIAGGPLPRRVRLGALTARRDFIDVRDVAAAVVAAVARADAKGVHELGRGVVVNVRDLVQLLIDVSGVDAQIDVQREQAGHSSEPLLCADPASARSILDWQPTHDLADAVRAYWEQRTSTTGTSTTKEIR